MHTHTHTKDMHVAAFFISADIHLRCHHHHARRRTCEHSHTTRLAIPSQAR